MSSSLHEELPLTKGGTRRQVDCYECTRAMAHQEKMTRRDKVQKYLFAVGGVAQIRLALLFLVDLPQSIMVVLYVVYIDKPSGLACRDCLTNGDFCKFGDEYEKGASFRRPHDCIFFASHLLPLAS